MAGAEFDGWLTVGITGGDGGGALSSIGIDWDTWTASAGLSTDNGAVFWMSPDDGPTGSAVIGQITVAGDWTAICSTCYYGSARRWRRRRGEGKRRRRTSGGWRVARFQKTSRVRVGDSRAPPLHFMPTASRPRSSSESVRR